MSEIPQKREMHFSLLTMPTLGHNDYGLWRHPANQKHRFHEPAFWRELARICEEAKMDSIFFADGLGIADSYGGSFDVSLREGMHVPVLDPAILAASVIGATTHLGVTITAASTFDPPFSHARRMATLDHITGGRAGWNVVMGFLKNAEDNYGVAPASSRQRYDNTEEFMEVCYKLWEGSWDDDAVVADRDEGVYIDPAKVRTIDHVGERFRCSGPALWDPSVQRTPVIFQAGMSDRGRLFAARHAEAVFVGNMNDETFRELTTDLRAKAASFGRTREDIKLLAFVAIVTGEDEAAARAKAATYQKWTRVEGYLAHVNALNGFNPLVHPRDRRLMDALAEDGFDRDSFAFYVQNTDFTVGEYIDSFRNVSRTPGTLIGDPVAIVDELERWMDDFDIDGFLLRSFMYPDSMRDFRDHIVPEMQRRGRYRTAYEGSSLRENLFGAGHRRLADSHPGVQFRPARVG